MVAVGNCSWKGYSSFMLLYILLIAILWCGCGFILDDGSWGFHWNSNIASVGGLFFRGFLGISIASVYFLKASFHITGSGVCERWNVLFG